MKYRSTRSDETITAEEALVKGLASDGGLYVPEELPAPFLDADLASGLCTFPFSNRYSSGRFEEIDSPGVHRYL